MRALLMTMVLIAGALCAASCGSDEPASPGEFGAECTADPDCNSPLVCFEFGMGQKLCTKPCTSAGDCSPESDQCNGMGYCKAD